jgi:hypothetical protein
MHTLMMLECVIYFINLPGSAKYQVEKVFTRVSKTLSLPNPNLAVLVLETLLVSVVIPIAALALTIWIFKRSFGVGWEETSVQQEINLHWAEQIARLEADCEREKVAVELAIEVENAIQ